MLLAPQPSSSPSPTPLPAIRRVYSWLKPPSLTLSQIGTQSDGERRDGARLSCFIQFHYSVWGGVSVLTLLCQHSGRGSCAVIWLESVTESQQCRVCQLIRCCQRTFRICDFSFWSSIKRQLNTFHGRLSVFWAELAKQLKDAFGAQVLTPSLAIFCLWNMSLFTVAATVLRRRTSKPEDNNTTVSCWNETQGGRERKRRRRVEKRRRERGEGWGKCETADRQMIWPLSRHDDSGMMAQLELIRIINWRNVLPPWCVGRFHAIGSTSD